MKEVPLLNHPDQQNQNDKFHPWKPGQMIQVANDEGSGKVPLFRGPRGRQKAFCNVPWGTPAMYVDCDGEPQSLMIKVIVGESIGWTYWMYGRDLK